LAVDANGAAGGLALIWNPNQVTLSNCFATPFSIFVDLYILGTNISGVIMNVYGPHNPRIKINLLESLQWIKTHIGEKHWLVGGDFNLITSLNE